MVVQLMIEKGAEVWNWGLSGACKGGHMEIVKLMIEKGATDWNRGLYDACEGGHIEIVKLMIEKGATDVESGKQVCMDYANYHILEYLNNL